MTVKPSPLVPASNPIDRLYRLVMGDRVLGALIILLALSVAVGLLLPQTPATLADPDAASRWLAETSSRYGNLGALLQSTGAFDLWHSGWFHGIVAALAFVLLLRLGYALGDAHGRLRHPNAAGAVAEARRWPYHHTIALEGDRVGVIAELTDDLRSEGWQVTSAETGSTTAIVAERSRWGLVAIPVFYAGVLLILAGLWLGQLAGWREEGLALLPGQPVTLTHDSRLTISLLDEDAKPDTLALQSNAGARWTGAFSPAGWARLAGLTIHRTGEGQALSITARDRNGASLQLQSSDQPSRAQNALELAFDQPRAEQVFYVPERELVVSVVSFPALPERGFAGPTFLVQAFQAGQRDPVFNQFVEGDTSLAVGDDTFQLATGRLVSVAVSRNPATPFTLAGGVLALVGLIGALWRPAGRLALSLRDAPRGPAHTARKSPTPGIDVDVWLSPAPLWRQASRWLLAWTGAYDRRDPD